MSIAFYAPLKPPQHPNPSGDREMARNLLLALGETTAVSELRSYDGNGDASRQDQTFDDAKAEIARLTQLLPQQRPVAWVTYHNYYKAPDLVGPAVCRALNLPYVQIESTRARKRLTGPWARFAEAAEAASDAADLIFYLTEHDRPTLERDRTEGQRLCHLRPFLPLEALPPAAPVVEAPRLLSVGMMRPGDKLASYTILAEALDFLTTADWQLEIVGDGKARAEVEEMMAPFGSRVTFSGRLERDELACAYGRAALFCWPGVNEAYGMVYLEAQAAGLPVVAQDRPGVRDVVYGARLSPDAGPEALAREIDSLLADPKRRVETGAVARAQVAAHHLLPAARETLLAGIRDLTEAAA